MSSSSTEKPLVSVMVPAYNAAGTIVETLDSVAVQSYRPIQLVIINDGSTDETGSIVRQWIEAAGASQLEIAYLEQPNKGLMACRNQGLELARGECLQFLDADDLVHPEKFAICVPYLQDGGFDLVVPRTARFRSSSEIALEAPPAGPSVRHSVRSHLISRTSWFTAGPLFTSDVVRRAGGFPLHVHPVAEELEFHARVKLLRPSIAYLDAVLSFYRVGQAAAITGRPRQVCEGRLSGAQAVHSLLCRHQITDLREWRHLLLECARTYFRARFHLGDPDLAREAMRMVRQVAHSSPGKITVPAAVAMLTVAAPFLASYRRLRSGRRPWRRGVANN